jgi:hypothetical protein
MEATGGLEEDSVGPLEIKAGAGMAVGTASIRTELGVLGGKCKAGSFYHCG